jgi:hypothetical protein
MNAGYARETTRGVLGAMACQTRGRALTSAGYARETVRSVLDAMVSQIRGHLSTSVECVAVHRRVLRLRPPVMPALKYKMVPTALTVHQVKPMKTRTQIHHALLAEQASMLIRPKQRYAFHALRALSQTAQQRVWRVLQASMQPVKGRHA